MREEKAQKTKNYFKYFDTNIHQSFPKLLINNNEMNALSSRSTFNDI